MRFSRVRQRWAEGKPAMATVCGLTDGSISEMTSLMGFDCIWMDSEHMPTSIETLSRMIRATRVGVSDVMARMAKGELMLMGRLLEAGAQGIMYPRCDNAAEAREVVRWAKFAPLGERGFSGSNMDQPYGSMNMGEYVEFANRETFLVIQVESPKAVKQSRAIAEVEGVDVVFFGPADFSVLSGNPGDFRNPILRKARARAARDAIAAGKRFGTLVFSADMAKECLDLGASLLCYGADLMFIKQGLETMQVTFGPLGFTFENRLKTGNGAYSVEPRPR
ncbi:MAG: aldolase [Verrucomicrobia bacterium]|nr:aldolase [Verrucomicrobiota bacterium]